MKESAMDQQSTLMFREAGSAGSLVEQHRLVNAQTYKALAQAWSQTPRPPVIVTLARGSSDNAATFARYLIERYLGVVTSSLAPSISSVYEAELHFANAILIAISQSGRSPDLVRSANRARANGATVIALVNDEASPLARDAQYNIALAAGPELSVAATKSFTLSLVAVLELIAAWSGDHALAGALDVIGDQIRLSWQLDWSDALAPMENATNMFVVARGHALGVAQEIALKLKETCGIHAEALSAAEVRHGPMTLVGRNFPVLLLGQPDDSRDDVASLAADFAARGACVMHSGLGIPQGISLPCIATNPVVTPILQLQSFYRLCETLSRRRGLDPDRPAHLMKVTRTI